MCSVAREIVFVVVNTCSQILDGCAVWNYNIYLIIVAKPLHRLGDEFPSLHR